MRSLYIIEFSLIYHKNKGKNTGLPEANECGEEAQKEPVGLINIWAPSDYEGICLQGKEWSVYWE